MDTLVTIFQDFVDWLFGVLGVLMSFLTDLALIVFELLLDGLIIVFNAITPPDFLSSGIGVLFQALHPDVVYFLSVSGVDNGLAIYGTGVSFRLLRKLFTLGQW